MKNLLLDFSKNEKSFVGFFHKMKLKDSLLRPQRTNAGTIRIIFIVLGTSFQGYWTNKKKQDLVFSVKLWFLRLEKMPKNDCPKMSKSYGVSKTSYNGSNKALFESKIQTKKQNSLGAVEQKDLYFYELYKKSKENKGNLTILYFYLRKWTEIWCQKGLFTVFDLKK